MLYCVEVGPLRECWLGDPYLRGGTSPQSPQKELSHRAHIHSHPLQRRTEITATLLTSHYSNPDHATCNTVFALCVCCHLKVNLLPKTNLRDSPEQNRESHQNQLGFLTWRG